jgi:hypothetical protein
MTFIPSNRRRFLQTSLAAAEALSAGLLVGSSRGDEPGVDAGPFATENPTIRQARRVALEILKPGATDLAHGLELHAGSLVFESYGFAPRAALDGADLLRERVQVFDPNGKFLAQWKEGGAPYGLFLTADRRLFVADGRASRVTILDRDGKALQHWGEPGAGPGQFAMPHAVCVDSHGDVYVAEINGRRLQKLTANSP